MFAKPSNADTNNRIPVPTPATPTPNKATAPPSINRAPDATNSSGPKAVKTNKPAVTKAIAPANPIKPVIIDPNDKLAIEVIALVMVFIELDNSGKITTSFKTLVQSMLPKLESILKLKYNSPIIRVSPVNP